MDNPDDTQSLYPYDGATLRLSGEVDLLTAPVLRLRLHQAAAGEGELLVDLSGVTFMDCAGLGPLLEARKYLGSRLRLRDLPDSLIRILRACELRSTFTVLDATDSPPGEEQSRPEEQAPRQPSASRRESRGFSSGIPPRRGGRVPAPTRVGDEAAITERRAGAPRSGCASASSQEALEGGRSGRRVARALELQEAVTNATLIGEAQGLLMGTLGCDADDAWQLLLDVCRAYGVRVGDLAAVLVGDATGTFVGIADPPLMNALRAVLPPAQEARAGALAR